MTLSDKRRQKARYRMTGGSLKCSLGLVKIRLRMANLTVRKKPKKPPTPPDDMLPIHVDSGVFVFTIVTAQAGPSALRG